ncbi:Rieske (2Fe-2S) protein [Actinomadura atramentaria]|uniref:Rieske (2Fe-2S) protein n=1 Tax=Actinomadura atramentaria TaxID=1990 RepID=UPI00039ECD69|nr:Rieske (2Fe-2S) protein [Actinomadura atramentaria]
MSDDVTPGADAAPETGKPGTTRRTVLCGAGAAGAVAALAACGPKDNTGAKPASDLRGTEIVKAADVPVGGGKIDKATKLVVTQPTAGQYRAFDATCTHQGCLTDRVTGGLIQCPCHGSEFRVADGTVARGPAKKKLTEYPVQLKGDGIVVA